MGSSGEKVQDRTQGRSRLPTNLARVNDAAKRSRQTRFTAVLHHVDVAALERAFRRLRRKAASGVDGMTVEEYEGKLEDNLRDLHDRLHGGRYRPQPVRRTYIPKADGGQRPLGILALEDKIVQGRLPRLLLWFPTRNGAPSPLLSNIFLHYVLDLWVEQWKRRNAAGRVWLVRYADDYLLLFQRQQDAERMKVALTERLAKFGLQLHEDKTRLVEFGRFAEEYRRRRGETRPEAFNFLGFTHYCGKSREGRFRLYQKTQRARMIRKLKELRQEMRRRMHQRVRDQHEWLCSVLRGHYAYYGIPGNSSSIGRFLLEVTKAWRRVLQRRSQRSKLTWDRFHAMLRVFTLPAAHIQGWRPQLA